MIRASILKFDQEITVARIRQAKIVLWTYDFQYKKITLFLLGASKISFGQVFFLLLLNLCFTYPNGQVVIKTYVAPYFQVTKKLGCNSLWKENNGKSPLEIQRHDIQLPLAEGHGVVIGVPGSVLMTWHINSWCIPVSSRWTCIIIDHDNLKKVY